MYCIFAPANTNGKLWNFSIQGFSIIATQPHISYMFFICIVITSRFPTFDRRRLSWCFFLGFTSLRKRQPPSASPRSSCLSSRLLSQACVSVSIMHFTVARNWRYPARRLPMLNYWRKLPPVQWCKLKFLGTVPAAYSGAVTLIIYLFSIVFCASTAIISNAFGVNSSAKICSQAILLCLSCYLNTKVSQNTS